MTTAERIHSLVQELDEARQQSVLAFVEFLVQRQEDEEWSHLSMALTLRGMEDEEWPEYTEADFVEEWAEYIETDFVEEVARVGQNAELMALLAERSKETKRYSLAEVQARLGLDEP